MTNRWITQIVLIPEKQATHARSNIIDPERKFYRTKLPINERLFDANVVQNKFLDIEHSLPPGITEEFPDNIRNGFDISKEPFIWQIYVLSMVLFNTLSSVAVSQRLIEELNSTQHAKAHSVQQIMDMMNELRSSVRDDRDRMIDWMKTVIIEPVD